jgi:perosamine synthetase
MPIRLNIPAWGPAELVAGTRALLPLPVRPLYVERLRTALQRAVPGRQPLPVRSARFGIALAIRALGLVGRRIAVPGYLCPAVLTALRIAPAEPFPIDCLPGSIRFDPQSLRREVAAGRIDAVLAPNTYGADQDFDTLAGLGLPVIEDAAYQAGREDAAGCACGGRGAAGVWSFNFKALTAAGGGVLWLPVDLLARAQEELGAMAGGTETAARFVNYALRGVLRHRIPGFLPGFARPGSPAVHPTSTTEPRTALLAPCEGQMSELQAALAYAQWRQRDALAAAQRARARQLAGVLARCSALAPLPGLAPEGAVHLMPVLVRVAEDDAPAAVLRARRILHAAGVQTEEAYPIPFAAPLPNARGLAVRLFLVPAGPALGARQLARIASALEQVDEDIAGQLVPPEPEETGAPAPEATP